MPPPPRLSGLRLRVEGGPDDPNMPVVPIDSSVVCVTPLATLRWSGEF
jgi:hypothetical protein